MERALLFRERKRLWCGLPWTFTVYSMDAERFYLQKGLLSQTEDEVRLYRILDVSVKRSLIQRMFGLGTIVICSSDQSLKNFEVKNIRHSKDIKECISTNVDIQRRKNRVYGREFISDVDDDLE